MLEKIQLSHKIIKKTKLHYFLAFLIGCTLFSCSTTKNIPEDKYLLKENKIKIDSKEISKKEIRKYIKQKSNRKTLGIKLPLYIYNLANPEKEKGISKWLKKNGEKPAIWDKYLTKESRTQIEYFLENEGYYGSKVEDTVILEDQKATVKYEIELNKPYVIDSLNFMVEDSVLKPYIFRDSSNTLIHPGDIFSVDLLQDERERIEKSLKDKGFYRFSKDFVSYIADTSQHKNLVDLKIVINKNVVREEGAETKRVSHKKYKIRNIYVYPNYDPKTVLADNEQYQKQLDTTFFNQIYFIYKNDPGIKKEVIRQANYIMPGQIYNQDDVNSTYNHLNSLRIFKFININFQEADSEDNELNCYIYLKKYKLQSYTIELEGTNSSGNIGGAGNLLYRHKSFLGGAEHFQAKLTGAFEILDQEEFTRLNSTRKLGVEVGLDVPKFMAPFLESERFVKKYTPKTSISGLYNYQQRPDYTRTITNLSFGYKWQGNRFLTHFVNPLELNILQLPFLSDVFKESINNTYLENSYKDHFLSVTSYSLVYNNQDVKKIKDFQFFRFNAEFAGNLLTGYNEIVDAETVNGNYQLFGIRYAQYFKIDFDMRYYQMLNPNNRFVYRFFIGGGLPYGNSEALPFVKQYFAGGANSIRAWNVRSLGPGSFDMGDIQGYPNQTADLKIETNWEYRFKLLGMLEGAIFTDVGNIWALNKSDNRKGAIFQFDKFLDDMAIGTGLGLRFDLSFSVIRLDLGLKFRDPAKGPDKRWLIGNRPVNHNTLTWNIAIGYPF
jgi:outer membrane protein assembly factor BamA